MSAGKDKVMKKNIWTEQLAGIQLLPLWAVLITAFIGIFLHRDTVDLLKDSIMVFLLTSACSFYIRMQEEDKIQPLRRWIIIAGYLFPLLLLLLIKSPQSYCLWLIGGLTVSMFLDQKLGILYFFSHTFLLSFFLKLKPELILYYLIIGVLMSLLATSLRTWQNAAYGSTIILSTGVTLGFILNNFLPESGAKIKYMPVLLSLLIVLMAVVFLSRFFERFNMQIEHSGKLFTRQTREVIGQTSEGQAGKEQIMKEEIAEAQLVESQSIQEQANTEHTDEEQAAAIDNRSIYEEIVKKEYSLLVRLKESSRTLYVHSKRIAEMSAEAALLVGADSDLARAGGWYHEIGRIGEGDYISEGQRLAQEHEFPKELMDIMRQHNIKYENPKFVESVIVMLSDNITSTIDYIKNNTNERTDTDQIIEILFQKRLEKGTFDESGLMLKDFAALKKFYQMKFRSY